MQNPDNTLSARELIHDIIPKLKTTEKLVNNTRRDLIAKAGSDAERNRHVQLQQECELEFMMIHMNLDHLLKRRAKETEDVVASGGNSPDVLLILDKNERFAIVSARQLYEWAQPIQAGK